jgi:transposase
MGLKRRVFSKEFKEQVLLEIEAGKSLAQAAREHEVGATLLAKWRSQREQYGERAFAGHGRAYTEEARIAVLERKIGQLTMENDFLKKALAKLDEIRSSRKGNGGGR